MAQPSRFAKVQKPLHALVECVRVLRDVNLFRRTNNQAAALAMKPDLMALTSLMNRCYAQWVKNVAPGTGGFSVSDTMVVAWAHLAFAADTSMWSIDPPGGAKVRSIEAEMRQCLTHHHHDDAWVMGIMREASHALVTRLRCFNVMTEEQILAKTGTLNPLPGASPQYEDIDEDAMLCLALQDASPVSPLREGSSDAYSASCRAVHVSRLNKRREARKKTVRAIDPIRFVKLLGRVRYVYHAEFAVRAGHVCVSDFVEAPEPQSGEGQDSEEDEGRNARRRILQETDFEDVMGVSLALSNAYHASGGDTAAVTIGSVFEDTKSVDLSYEAFKKSVMAASVRELSTQATNTLKNMMLLRLCPRGAVLEARRNSTSRHIEASEAVRCDIGHELGTLAVELSSIDPVFLWVTEPKNKWTAHAFPLLLSEDRTKVTADASVVPPDQRECKRMTVLQECMFLLAASRTWSAHMRKRKVSAFLDEFAVLPYESETHFQKWQRLTDHGRPRFPVVLHHRGKWCVSFWRQDAVRKGDKPCLLACESVAHALYQWNLIMRQPPYSAKDVLGNSMVSALNSMFSAPINEVQVNGSAVS